MTTNLFKDLFKVFKREKDEDGVNPQAQLVTVHPCTHSQARFDVQYEKGAIVGQVAHAVVMTPLLVINNSFNQSLRPHVRMDQTV